MRNGNGEEFNTDKDTLKQITDRVQEELNLSNTPGACIALFINGEPILNAGIGFWDLEKRIIINEDAQFYIYSVTKTLIAAVILQLVAEGSVGLDTPVQKYLPQLPIKVPVTIRQILNHTGGIPDYGVLPAYFERMKADPRHPWNDEDFLKATLSNGLIFAPGESWQYSNIGYLLIRRVIEIILDTSFSTAMHDQIFARLGLKNTTIARNLVDAQNLTPGYSSFFSVDNSMQDIRSIYHPGWVSHGVAISTAIELAQMVDAIFAGPILGPDERTAILDSKHVNIQHPFFQQPAYGLGVMIDLQSQYGIMVGHGGGGPGYSAGVLHFPSIKGHRITSAALCNHDRDGLGLKLAFQAGMKMGSILTDNEFLSSPKYEIDD